MKKDVIQRNLERLIYSDFAGEKEPIEPMTEWKWRKLYQTARENGIGSWVADGIRRYEEDFFLQMSPTLHQQFLDLPSDKDNERLSKYQLQVDRKASLLRRFSRKSLRTYANDIMQTIQNIEE